MIVVQSKILVEILPKPAFCKMLYLPTPPFPDNISIFRFTFFRFSAIRAISGSGPLGVADEQIC